MTLPRIDDAPDLHQTHRPRERDLDLRDLGHVGPVVDGARDTATAPATRTLVPATPLSDPLDNAAETVVLDMAQPEREWFLI